MSRLANIREFGIEIVEDDERYWKSLGYKINYATGLLERTQ